MRVGILLALILMHHISNGQGKDNTWVFDESNKSLNQRQLRNLVAFSKLYGYLRFFHPSDQALKADWDWYTVQGIKHIENAANDEDLVSNLERWGQRVAPSMSINHQTDITHASSDKIRYWWHSGFGGHGFKGSHFDVYKSRPKNVKVSGVHERDYFIPSPDSIFSLELVDKISLYLPATLYTKGGRSLPRGMGKVKNPDDKNFSAQDRSVRLGIVIIAWNIMYHFYPYWDVVEVDWDKVLEASLIEASADKNTYDELGNTLYKLIAAAEDGHGAIFFRAKNADVIEQYYTTPGSLIPMTFKWVQEKVVISDCNNCDSLGVHRGDIVNSINDTDILQILSERERMSTGATDNLRKRIAMLWIGQVPGDSLQTLSLTDSVGNTYQISVAPAFWYGRSSKSPPYVKELTEGIYYVDLTRIRNTQLKRAIRNELKLARGIVFDLRGYPNVRIGFLKHLSAQPLKSARWMIPIKTRPGVPVAYDTSGRWTLRPRTPYLSSEIVFLTDEMAISYAETVMGIVEHYQLGEIVGTPTAGTNGNVVRVELLAGFHMIFTGMKVLKHDGSQHHAVGILPTFPFPLRIEGIRSGEDQQLEKALSIIQKSLD